MTFHDTKKNNGYYSLFINSDAPIIGIIRLSAILPIIGIGRLLCRYRPIFIYYVLW